MCGRFVGYRNVEELKAHFPIDRFESPVNASYNIAPSQPVLAIVHHSGENVLEQLNWGLVPFWAKDKAIGNKLINARSETVAEKPSFRQAFQKRRCLILADGFYEWMKTKTGKQPVYITLPDKAPFAFAGLWETWQDREKSQAPYRSCTIITRPASPSIQPVHHRMPVILAPDIYDAWLDPQNQDSGAMHALIQSNAISEMVYAPVSRQVNTPGYNKPANIKPVQMEFDF